MGRKKKKIRLKEPVRIREKKISGGNISLYLDIYQNGLRKKETLKLYLVPEINAATKLQNDAELSASSVKTKRNMYKRIDQYLLYIGKPEYLLKEVDKDFCKGFIVFLKTCTYNDGKKKLCFLPQNSYNELHFLLEPMLGAKSNE